MAHGMLTVFYVGNTLWYVRINKSADCKLIVVWFGSNLVELRMEEWKNKGDRIFSLGSFIRTNAVICVQRSFKQRFGFHWIGTVPSCKI